MYTCENAEESQGPRLGFTQRQSFDLGVGGNADCRRLRECLHWGVIAAFAGITMTRGPRAG